MEQHLQHIKDIFFFSELMETIGPRLDDSTWKVDSAFSSYKPFVCLIPGRKTTLDSSITKQVI